VTGGLAVVIVVLVGVQQLFQYQESLAADVLERRNLARQLEDFASRKQRVESVVSREPWRWESIPREQGWDAKPYRVANRPAVRYENAGHYIKFEVYDDSVSANWSTISGPQVLLSIPLYGEAATAQFWTSDTESGEHPLGELAYDILQAQSNIIRAWVETEHELIVWRLGDTSATGVAQLGVLMRFWNPRRVEELVNASATTPVQSTIGERIEAANELLALSPDLP
jgi:hypothetical protein